MLRPIASTALSYVSSAFIEAGEVMRPSLSEAALEARKAAAVMELADVSQIPSDGFFL